MSAEFDILQLEKIGVILELLADATLLKAINVEEMELREKENHNHNKKENHNENKQENEKENKEHSSECRSIRLRVSGREVQLIGRLILAIAILKIFQLEKHNIKDINDIRKLQSTHKILTGEWIVVIGTLLTYTGNREMLDICRNMKE